MLPFASRESQRADNANAFMGLDPSVFAILNAVDGHLQDRLFQFLPQPQKNENRQ